MAAVSPADPRVQDVSSWRGGTRSTIPDSKVPVKTYGMNPSVNVREESKGDLVRSNTSTVKTTAETTVPVTCIAEAAKIARNSGLASAAA
jgi:hypothetical protein